MNFISLARSFDIKDREWVAGRQANRNPNFQYFVLFLLSLATSAFFLLLSASYRRRSTETLTRWYQSRRPRRAPSLPPSCTGNFPSLPKLTVAPSVRLPDLPDLAVKSLPRRRFSRGRCHQAQDRDLRPESATPRPPLRPTTSTRKLLRASVFPATYGPSVTDWIVIRPARPQRSTLSKVRFSRSPL
jgi:hypothetical protein